MSIGPIPEKAIRTLIRPLLPENFSVCELGDQLWISDRKDRKVQQFTRPALDLWRELGVGRYETIDANGNATIFADLNYPLDPHPGQFDLVTDFGTAEHVWDFCQVWRTMHSLCKPSGIIMFEKQAQGWANHGFYNVQRCYFDDLVAVNGEWIYIDELKGHNGIYHDGAYRVTSSQFVIPQQGKYKASLKIAC